jgi:ubiquinone/menaquinone biosynthesis C-methylase UbiE
MIVAWIPFPFSLGAVVGLYSRFIYPCVCDLLMRQEFLAKHRRELLAGVSGEILEIGFGTGLNLPHYPPQVRRITAVDLSPGMHRIARERIASSGIEVDLQVGDCQNLPFENDRFDCVISSWTLCSIDDVDRAVAEIYRVLKPGGRFLFIEHGLSPEPNVQKWQRRLNWLQMRLAEGCRLDRNIKAIVSTPPFSSLHVDEFYMTPGPKTHNYMFRGAASK